MKKFTYFANHGDENGKNCWTICYGKPDGDEIIIGVENRKSDAIEMCKRLNKIISEKKELVKEAKRLTRRLLPWQEFGESDKAERLWDILGELG